jgi:hypothetical protein
VVCDLSDSVGEKRVVSVRTVANTASNSDVHDDGKNDIDFTRVVGKPLKVRRVKING